MTAPRLLLLLATCFGVSLGGLAQRTLTLEDAAGRLAQRTTLDALDRPTLIEVFAQGQLQRRTKRTYDDRGRLTEEVNTLFDDHEYDLIEQYSYDGDLLTGKLIGNNRSGRWSSEGYAYDAHGELLRIDHFRKNGTLAYQTHFALDYRDTLLVEKVRTKVVLPVDSLHEAWENEVAIGDAPVPEPGEVEEAYAKTSYTYDARGRLTGTAERDRSGTLRLTAERDYPSGLGYRETTTFYEPTGEVSFRETVTYDALGRVRSRRLGTSAKQYEYYGNTDVVRRVRDLRT